MKFRVNAVRNHARERIRHFAGAAHRRPEPLAHSRIRSRCSPFRATRPTLLAMGWFERVKKVTAGQRVASASESVPRCR
jgi:hypothetical protein